MRPASATGEAPSPAPIANAAEAELVVKHLTDVMDALLASVEEETALVRAGKLGQAAKLEPTKEELSRLYAMDTARLKASRAHLSRSVPDLIASLRKRHDNFHAVLQMNLTVLATAHAVSESIMRGVSDELARKATPQGYGSSGRTVAPGASGLQPLTLSRVL